MGNIIKSLCCKDSPSEADNEQEEQSRIWSENGNNCQQYGACLPPPPPTIYKIVLPKLIPVEIEQVIAIKSLSTSQCLNNSSPITTLDNIDPSTRASPIEPQASEARDGDEEQERPSVVVDTLVALDDQPNGISQSDSVDQQQQQQQQPAVIKEEYCADQFETIRALIIQSQEGHRQFRELLWSCIPWAAPGGKSGSTFLKTINDQFILKEMSKLELQSFLTIADDYFSYIENSYHDNKPSLLSTIFGIYRIVYTNSATQSSSEYYFMVMRNLFYKRNIAQRFDLKGSMRNRLVDTNDPDNTESVLMDGNLLRITCEHPILIHARSKQILNEAIYNDSKFLTSISVMDYSLLVGVDKENQELVLGIIDYVRPFTWDKKIERVVKSVVSTELPTIVEPELYRERFCEAMDKYFESVPDDW